MARLLAVRSERVWMLVLYLGLAGALLLAPGRAAAEEGGLEDNPPAIAGGEVTPANLSYEGGNVQLRAEVVDDVGVQMVYAHITGSDGTNQTFQLFEGYLNNYFGTFEAPANPSDSAATYEVEIQAYDTANNFSASTIGGIQVEGAPQFDEPPYLSEPLVWPQFLPASGGTVVISADASDNRAISAVFATIALPGGGSAEVPLQPVGPNHYEGSFEVPANPGPLAAEYLVEIVARDDIGQEGRAGAGTITVEAPPKPPSSGLLELWPSNRSFGSVVLGRESQRLVFVRNLPRRGGEPVEAMARIVGSSAFSLAGGSSSGVHLLLHPGEKRAMTVGFRPTAAGLQSASLEIVRDDGGQPGLAVNLSGRGISRR
jgi:hypothetical protein